MSVKAIDWAMEADCPSAPAKLVLIIYANFANERGWAYPSTETVVRLSGLNVKTARAAIDALERAELLIDTSRRTGVTKQIKVFALGCASLPKSDPFPAGRPQAPANDPEEATTGAPAGSRPKTGAFGKTPKNDGKAPKSGRQNRQEPLPPDDASASSAPRGGGRGRGERISGCWSAPSVADLPPHARSIADQWPAGAYEAEAEAFRSYWLGEGRAGSRKLDWAQTWCNRITQLGSKPLRDARAGLTYTTPAGGGPGMSAEDQAARLEASAASFERMGRHDDAAEMRRSAARARGG